MSGLFLWWLHLVTLITKQLSKSHQGQLKNKFWLPCHFQLLKHMNLDFHKHIWIWTSPIIKDSCTGMLKLPLVQLTFCLQAVFHQTVQLFMSSLSIFNKICSIYSNSTVHLAALYMFIQPHESPSFSHTTYTETGHLASQRWKANKFVAF